MAMTRRAFAQRLAALLGMVTVAPTVLSRMPEAPAIDWATKPDFTRVVIPQRTLAAKIRFTGPEIAASRFESGQLMKAHQAWLDELCADVQRREAAELGRAVRV